MRNLTQAKIINTNLEEFIMHKKAFVSFILFLFSIAAIAQAKSTYTKEFKKTIDFHSKGQVEVKTTNGNIDMTSWDRNALEVEAEIKVKARSQRDAEKILDKVKILIEKSGDRITIAPDYPKRHDGDGFWDWVFGSESRPVVNFKIKVPRETNPTARSTNGRIYVSDIEGETELKTTNGGIEARDMLGSVDAKTTNGSISIYVAQFGNDDRLDLNTTNGSIELTLPSDVKANIEASTVNGSIRTDFPMTVQGKISRKRLDGVINDGGGSIELSTINGSISIYEE